MGRVDALGGVASDTRAVTPIATSAVIRSAWGWRVLVPLVTAAAAAVVTLAVVNARQPARDARLAAVIFKAANERVALLQFVLDSQNRTVGQLQERLAQQRQLAESLQKPTTAVVSLAGVGQARAAARLVWDPAGGRAVLLTTGLTPPPAGRTYELWYIPAGHQPVRATTFGVAADGTARGRRSRSSRPGPAVANGGERRADRGDRRAHGLHSTRREALNPVWLPEPVFGPPKNPGPPTSAPGRVS